MHQRVAGAHGDVAELRQLAQSQRAPLVAEGLEYREGPLRALVVLDSDLSFESDTTVALQAKNRAVGCLGRIAGELRRGDRAMRLGAKHMFPRLLWRTVM